MFWVLFNPTGLQLYSGFNFHQLQPELFPKVGETIILDKRLRNTEELRGLLEQAESSQYQVAAQLIPDSAGTSTGIKLRLAFHDHHRDDLGKVFAKVLKVLLIKMGKI